MRTHVKNWRLRPNITIKQGFLSRKFPEYVRNRNRMKGKYFNHNASCWLEIILSTSRQRCNTKSKKKKLVKAAPQKTEDFTKTLIKSYAEKKSPQIQILGPNARVESSSIAYEWHIIWCITEILCLTVFLNAYVLPSC